MGGSSLRMIRNPGDWFAAEHHARFTLPWTAGLSHMTPHEPESPLLSPLPAFAGRGEVRRRLYFRSIPFSEEVFRAGRQSNAIALPWTGRVGSEHLRAAGVG